MNPVTNFLDVLAHLAEIGRQINRFGGESSAGAGETLSLLCTLAGQDLPGAQITIRPAGETPESADWAAPDDPFYRWLQLQAVEANQLVMIHAESTADGPSLPAAVQAGACLPLLVADKLLGCMFAMLPDRQAFTATELLILESYANLAGMALASAQQINTGQQETLRRERELRRLRRAGMLVSSKSSLKGTLEIILRMALEVMDAEYGIFRLIDEGGSNLVTQAFAGDNLGKPAVEALPVDEHSIMGIVALRREPLIIPDLNEAPWRDVYYPFDHELVMRSELAVPLIGASGRLEGVLNLESPQVNAFSRQDRYVLQIFATQAVIAIQEARLLSALKEISELLLIQPLSVYHQTLVARAVDLLNVTTSQIWLREGQALALHASSAPVVHSLRLPLDGAFIGQAVRSGQPVFCAEECADLLQGTGELLPVGEAGFALAMPLFSGDDTRALGAFAIAGLRSDLRDIDQAEWYKKVLNILGYYAALAIQYRTDQDTLRAVQEQRALAETFAAVGDISTNLLHSLNNKIGTIPVRVEGIQAKSRPALASDPYLAANLAEIEHSAAEAIQIVQENLFHLRPIQLQPVAIDACVHEAVETIGLPPGIHLETEGLEGLPPVLAGQKRLAFVFVNLIENSLDAMGGQGRIRIEGRDRENVVEIKVIDDGPGIDPALHDRIFEFTYSTRASERPGKLGFGLWWVKTLIARFGGALTVESDGQHGTAFCFTLPSTQQPAEKGRDD
ncbi:MAG: GAF domain-containing protein [Anaerolineales bacterium]